MLGDVWKCILNLRKTCVVKYIYLNLVGLERLEVVEHQIAQNQFKKVLREKYSKENLIVVPINRIKVKRVLLRVFSFLFCLKWPFSTKQESYNS